jgi:hypothetical protein
LDLPDKRTEVQRPDKHDVDIEMIDGGVNQLEAECSWEPSTGACQQDDDELCEEDVDFEESTDADIHSSIPVILPRARFAGACNVETVKDGM